MILIDDQPYGQSCPSDKTVRELARETCAATSDQARRMVVAIYCNGKAVTDDELNAVLDAPAGSFEQLELQTQPVAGLVRTTLEQAIALVDSAAPIRAAAADLLDGGDYVAAMGQFQKLLEIWRQLQQSLVFCSQALEINLDTLTLDGCRFTDLANLTKANLADLREAIRNQDPVLIGDLLRYDLEEVFAKWETLLRAMQQSVIKP
ncbi:MAG TPA: hypothetical protein PK184_12695 [Phycisphaerae bacterium]|jgi:bacterioferritin-associated ferredoxin|nr:hypothetical protein [Phycisphaerae bacterium]